MKATYDPPTSSCSSSPLSNTALSDDLLLTDILHTHPHSHVALHFSLSKLHVNCFRLVSDVPEHGHQRGDAAMCPDVLATARLQCQLSQAANDVPQHRHAVVVQHATHIQCDKPPCTYVTLQEILRCVSICGNFYQSFARYIAGLI